MDINKKTGRYPALFANQSTIVTTHGRYKIAERYGSVDGTAAQKFSDDAYRNGRRIDSIRFPGQARSWIRRRNRSIDKELVVFDGKLFIYDGREKPTLVTTYKLPERIAEIILPLIEVMSTEGCVYSFEDEDAHRKGSEAKTRKAVYHGKVAVKKPKTYYRLNRDFDYMSEEFDYVS